MSPDRKSDSQWISVPAGVAAASTREKAPPVRPRRLSHVLIFTRDVSESIKFYERTLGLRLSDRASDLVAFMHGIHGSDHHLLALVKSIAPGFHHCSWDVSSVNDIGLGAMRMHDKGWTKGWGQLGRHVLGSNYFHYVRDPWGSFAEYSCDIDYIPKEERWPSGDHKPEDFLPLGSGRAARIHDQLRRRRELTRSNHLRPWPGRVPAISFLKIDAKAIVLVSSLNDNLDLVARLQPVLLSSDR